VTSLGGFVLFYTALAVVDAVLMMKYARKGPDELGLWPARDIVAPAGASTAGVSP
jgi:cytochrome bd ubiquinol oxidase subunit I